MFKHYLKIALRNIKRNPTYSILNISGMSIGLACSIIIYFWVHDEWSYDKQFENANNLYRITENQNPSAGETSLFAISPGLLTNMLKKEYPEIIRSSRYEPHMELRLKKGAEFEHEIAVAAVDTDFLKMFNIYFVRGDMNSALNDAHNVVITEEVAHKYFGTEDALGKTFSESLGYQLTVTGVIKRLRNSHLRFDFLVPMELLNERGAPTNNWEFRCYNYIELYNGTNGKLVNNKIRNLLKKHIKGSNSEIYLQNIKKIHLYSSKKYTYDVSGHGDINYVRIMSLIAIFILLMACINFMNLSTAHTSRRAKEIGVRKLLGAHKQKIIVQFLGDSLLIVFASLLIALVFVELLLPFVSNYTNKQLIINYQSSGFYVGLIVIVLLCSLMAGSYPALYLSTLKPINMMKGVMNKKPGNTQFRRIMVVFQFSLSIILMICTLIVEAQLTYIQNKKLGFNKDNIGYFMFPTAPWDPKLEILKKELLNNPNIESVTKVFYNYENPLNIEGTSEGYSWTGKKEGVKIPFYELSADQDYAKTFQLVLKEGRFFSSEFSTDNSAVVINEQAANIMGFKKPIGEMISTTQGVKLKIIGVVKDFHFKPLQYKIEPLLIRIGNSNTLFIRIKPGLISSTVESIKKTYNSFKPDIPLNFHFLDNDFENLYRKEQRMSKLFGYCTFLAIMISCLGLIGLSSFMIDHRTKEIGLRKANGANSNEIFLLLSKEYLLWVIISIIIACPFAWYVMNKWLQSFAYRINISCWLFALAGIVTLAISLLTVGIQSYKAARKNPMEALRYE